MKKILRIAFIVTFLPTILFESLLTIRYMVEQGPQADPLHFFSIVFIGGWLVTSILFFMDKIVYNKRFWYSEKQYQDAIEDLKKEKEEYNEATDNFIKKRRTYTNKLEELNGE